jgi:hypothetical protein
VGSAARWVSAVIGSPCKVSGWGAGVCSRSLCRCLLGAAAPFLSCSCCGARSLSRVPRGRCGPTCDPGDAFCAAAANSSRAAGPYPVGPKNPVAADCWADYSRRVAGGGGNARPEDREPAKEFGVRAFGFVAGGSVVVQAATHGRRRVRLCGRCRCSSRFWRSCIGRCARGVQKRDHHAAAVRIRG